MKRCHHPRRRKLRRALALFVMALALAAPGCTGEAPGDTPPTGGARPSREAGPPEGTDVWLLDLVREGGAMRGSQPRNLTDRPGYDNQPHWTSSGQLLYVQMEGERTDLWRWDPQTDRATRLTATPAEGEYSPTPLPGGGSGISYIRSRTDTTGRLWRMPREGAEPEIVFPDIGPVGYHAWFDGGAVALWLLRDPSILQLVDLATEEARTLAVGVGRSPQSVPNRRAVSYTRATDEGTAIEVYDLDLDRTETLAVLPEGGEFHAWTPEGLLLGSAASRVVVWRDGAWQTVVELGHLGLLVSRLAVSPDGARLAVVGEPAG